MFSRHKFLTAANIIINGYFQNVNFFVSHIQGNPFFVLTESKYAVINDEQSKQSQKQLDCEQSNVPEIVDRVQMLKKS